MGKRALAVPWKCYGVLCISSYSKALDRSIVYALLLFYYYLKNRTRSTNMT